MRVTRQTTVVSCPECEEEITFEAQLQLGQRVTCPECWADLQIVNLDPLKLTGTMDEFEEDFSAEVDSEFEDDLFFEDDLEDEEDSDFADDRQDEA